MPTTTHENIELGGYAGIVWLIVSGLVGALLHLYLKVEQIGPRIVWSTDACPGQDVVCGVVPLGFIPAVAVAALLFVGGFGLYNRLQRRRDGDMDG